MRNAYTRGKYVAKSRELPCRRRSGISVLRKKEPTFNMKLLKITSLFGGLLALATSLSAESATVNFNVPFSFVAGGKVLPAGTYTILEPNPAGVFLIRGTASDSAAMVLVVNGGPTTGEHASVSFNKSGSTPVLSVIDIPGEGTYTVSLPEHKTAAALSLAAPRK
jgi:hypothetical protein